MAGKWSDDVGIVFTGNRARESLLPSTAAPSADYVPIKDGDRVGASDPMTALLVNVGGSGATTVPQACERTVAVFDGHTRYNLRLAFERFSTAHPTEGYQGQVVVCSAKFLPVAGYDPKHFLVTYLAAQHETEIWLAPLGSTRLLVPTGPPFQRPWGLAFWRRQNLFLLRIMRAKAIESTWDQMEPPTLACTMMIEKIRPNSPGRTTRPAHNREAQQRSYIIALFAGR